MSWFALFVTTQVIRRIVPGSHLGTLKMHQCNIEAAPSSYCGRGWGGELSAIYLADIGF